MEDSSIQKQQSSERGRERERSGEGHLSQSRERMRILFFGCDRVDVQRALTQENSVEIAYLPSRDADEIQREITRFSPQLIVCRSEFFLTSQSFLSEFGASGNGDRSSPIASKSVQISSITPREAKVLSMLVQGKTNKQIAKALTLSPRTVKRTLSELFERFGVSNRTELSNLTGRLSLLIK